MKNLLDDGTIVSRAMHEHHLLGKAKLHALRLKRNKNLLTPALSVGGRVFRRSKRWHYIEPQTATKLRDFEIFMT